VARVLLLLPTATYRAPDFLDAARALDVEVVVASEARQTLAEAMGDRALHLDLADPDAAAQAVVDLARRAPLDAVVAVDDQGVLVAAEAAARLGLPANPLAAVAATRDKSTMRRAFAAAGVPQPEFRVCGPDDDVADVATTVGLPCVVKPVSLSGSRGVIRADTSGEAAAAAARVRRILAAADEDPHGPLLVESFVGGDEVALEGLVRGGALEVLAIFDKPNPLDGPYFEETIYVTPSRKDAATLAGVAGATAIAIAALGLREGPVHAEMRVVDGEACVLEVAARSIGGLCSRALRFGAGVSLEEVILRHALGLPLDGIRRETAAAGVMMLPIPRAGTLVAVRGRDEARRVAGIAGLEITIHPGRPVHPLPEGDRYLGFLFARGDTPEAVETALRAAHAELDVVIEEPGLP
jgi:biotin carboxylase